MINVFQITQAHVDSSSLTLDSVGKWCYVAMGCIMGFFTDREAAEEEAARWTIG